MTLESRKIKAVQAICAEVGLDWATVADVLGHLPQDAGRDRIVDALTTGSPDLGTSPVVDEKQASAFTDAYLAL